MITSGNRCCIGRKRDEDLVLDGKLCLPGEGVFDFHGLISALRSIGYNGPVIMEPYLGLIKSDEALMRSVAFMRNIMKE